jgi:DNA-binding CsgD family transcriptional regulator
MELLGIAGFSLMLSWSFSLFFCFLLRLPEGLEDAQGYLAIFLFFAGIVIGYLLIRLAAARVTYRIMYRRILVVCLLVSLGIPVSAILSYFGIVFSSGLFACLCLLTGLATSYCIVSWLDICGKTRVHNLLVFTSASFSAGILLFFLCYFMPVAMQPATSIFFVTLSIALLTFVNSRSQGNGEVVLRKRSDMFPSPLEFEPLFFVFGAVFGVVCVLLFKQGEQALLMSAAAMFIATVALTVIAFLNFNLTMIGLLRVIIVAIVGVCLLVSAASGLVLDLGLCAVSALWAVFTAANFANLLKLVTIKKLQVFYHISAGLIPKSAGFMVGAAGAALLAQGRDLPLGLDILMLSLVFALVLVSMVFYPQTRHHEEEEKREDFTAPVTVAGLGPEKALDMKCEAVTKLYQLSPRESDVLRYLARGRNAEYICEKLFVSSHTVKSHIYSIYRKTNMHTQQKIMDLIEEYPVKEI